MGGQAGPQVAAVEAAEGHHAGPSGPRAMRVVASPPAAAAPGQRVVVADTTWTPPAPADAATSPPISIRDVAAGVLQSRDLVAETTTALDGWARESGVVESLTVDGTSFWHYYRLREWSWLQEQLLWLAIATDLLADPAIPAVEVGTGVDRALVDALRLLTSARGIPLVPDVPDDGADAAAQARGPSPGPGRPLHGPIRRLRRALLARLGLDEPLRRKRFVVARLGRLEREPGRLLVVLEHARQRVETPGGPRSMNAYLGPVVERLRGTRLAPIEVDIRLRLSSREDWARLRDGGERLLPWDAVWIGAAPEARDDRQSAADRAADAIVAASTSLPVADGVDLGPVLAARVADDVRRTLAGLGQNVVRIGDLLRRLRPAGLLLADEYHRQDWLAAAAAAGIPSAAVQHGLIWRGHAGYVHPDRPSSLRLPARTYVFGPWEARLLTTGSVYRDDEVVVGGSPRLDLVGSDAVDRDAVRAELGVRPGDRLVVVSGTWGSVLRRFHYPISLAAIADRPLPGVHLVIKLHPGEPDDGPYRAVIEGAARARGEEPPPITTVRSIDLYRLLAAADAHIGIHSTVLTEAVWAGTPNLLVDLMPAADLLGYVAAGVARPIRNGADLLAALDEGDGTIDETARRRFLEGHFAPGDASGRIADDLLAWLP